MNLTALSLYDALAICALALIILAIANLVRHATREEARRARHIARRWRRYTAENLAAVRGQPLRILVEKLRDVGGELLNLEETESGVQYAAHLLAAWASITRSYHRTSACPTGQARKE